MEAKVALDWTDYDGGCSVCVGRLRLDTYELARTENRHWWSVGICYGRNRESELKLAGARAASVVDSKLTAEAWLRAHLAHVLAELCPGARLKFGRTTDPGYDLAQDLIFRAESHRKGVTQE